MDRLTTPPTADERLWTRFQSGQCSDEEIASSLALQRWARSARLGVRPEGPLEPVVTVTRLPSATDALSPLLMRGGPFEAFANVMTDGGFCGVMSDPDGIVVSRRAAETFKPSLMNSLLVEGADWSERARGTNGIGTAIAEQAPVAIIGVEHFEQRNHGLACYTAPVRDVRDRIVGVLDASGPLHMAGHSIHAAVAATTAALEALLVARAYDEALPGGLFALERLLGSLTHAALVLEATGRVRRTNVALRALLPGVSEPEIAGLFGGGAFASLAGLSASRRGTLPPPLRSMSIEIEPIGGPEDPFSAIVHLLQRRRQRPAPELPESVSQAFAPIAGSDPLVSSAREQAARFARTDLPVLLLAETGTGKELFARAVHAGSTRADGPFVAVNCGTLTGTLLESELFGYGPGAFTGAATQGRFGKLAAADGGTLFLDEVGEMPLSAQAMLLRFLEDGTFYRVGEATERRADVRLVAATSRDLPALAADGRFRSDLYYRMRGVVLRLPPLRERTDRRELAEALLAGLARKHLRGRAPGLSPAAIAWIERHGWPGNVRELRTALEYALVLAGDAPRLEIWHLPEQDAAAGEKTSGDLRNSAERAAVLQALDHARGNLSDAARVLGVARSTLYRMMERHGLRAEGPSPGAGA